VKARSGPGGLHFFGNDLEPQQRGRAEGGRNGGIGGVAPPRHQDAADARLVVARIHGMVGEGTCRRGALGIQSAAQCQFNGG
jgi:hypothetical protein